MGVVDVRTGVPLIVHCHLSDHADDFNLTTAGAQSLSDRTSARIEAVGETLAHENVFRRAHVVARVERSTLENGKADGLEIIP